MPKDIMASVEPTLSATNGAMFICTTPQGFSASYEFWLKCKEEPDWYCLNADWTVSPHYSPGFIERAKKRLGQNKFNQEYCAVPVAPDGAKFDHAWLENIMVSSLPQECEWSAISVDLSKGRRYLSDLQAVVYGCWALGSFWIDARADRLPLPVLMQVMKELYHQWRPTAGFIMETNGFEKDVEEFTRIWAPHPSPFIGRFHAQEQKEIRIERLAYWLERREIKILDNDAGKLLWKQLSNFGSPSAQVQCRHGGIGDDIIDALAQLTAYYKTPEEDIR